MSYRVQTTITLWALHFQIGSKLGSQFSTNKTLLPVLPYRFEDAPNGLKEILSDYGT